MSGCQTNMIMVDVEKEFPNGGVTAALKEHGVMALDRGGGKLRLVTHYGIDEAGRRPDRRSVPGGDELAMVNLGIMLEGQEDLTWEKWHDFADRTEGLGFESLWRSDHLHPLVLGPDKEVLEAWISFATLAARTERIRFRGDGYANDVPASERSRQDGRVYRRAVQGEAGDGAGGGVVRTGAHCIRHPVL